MIYLAELTNSLRVQIMPHAMPVETKPSHTRLSETELVAFLSALAKTGSVAAAARAINRPRSTLHSALKADASLRLAAESAQDSYVSVLLSQAHKLAVEGVSTPILNRDGNPTGEFKVKYSERILLALLSRRDPDFAPSDKKTVVHEGEIKHTVVAPSSIPNDVFAAMPMQARLGYKKALLVTDARRGAIADDNLLVHRIAELGSEYEMAGLEFDPLATFHEAKAKPAESAIAIAEAAQLIEDAEYTEVTGGQYTDAELLELIPL